MSIILPWPRVTQITSVTPDTFAATVLSERSGDATVAMQTPSPDAYEAEVARVFEWLEERSDAHWQQFLAAWEPS